MKTNFEFCIGLLLVVALAACKEKRESAVLPLTVRVKDTVEVPLSVIAEKVERIELETSPASLTGKWMKMQMAGENIFVFRLKQEVLEFGRDGRFKRKIGAVGKGPGEYQMPVSMVVDGDALYLLVTGNKILKYDTTGRFIETIPLKERWNKAEWNERFSGQEMSYVNVNDFSHLPEGYVFCGEENWIKTEEGDLRNITWVILTDKNFRQTKEYVVRDYRIPKLSLNLFGSCDYFSLTEEGLYIFPSAISREVLQNDTLFLLRDDQLERKVNFRFDGVERREKDNLELVVSTLSASPRYLMANYNKNAYCYDRKTGETYNAAKGFSDDICHTGKVLLRPCGNGDYYFVKEAYELSGREEDEANNPVLFRVVLKR